MNKILTLKYLLLFLALITFSSCKTNEPWDYPHLLDPQDYVRYYKNFDLLRNDLEKKDYVHEPYGTLHGNPHEMWEQTFVELNYSSTVIIRYNNSEDKTNANVTSFETWITTDGEEQNKDRFKTFIDGYVNRIKNHFPKRLAQKHDNGSEYELTLSSEKGYHVTIKNQLEESNQFIVIVNRKTR